MFSPLSENMTTMVKSRAIRVMGLIRGMNFVSYQSFPLSLSRVKRVMHAGEEGDAQIDEDALGDLADGDVDGRALQPEPGGQDGDEDIGVDREEEDLEDGVEGDQAGRVFACRPWPARSRR